MPDLRRIRPAIRGLKALLAAGAVLVCVSAFAAEPCGICATRVVVNPELAQCFLSRYDGLAATEGEAIAVDLTGCEEARGGVVEALPQPGASDAVAAGEPDTQFILTRTQLGCLKGKLQDPATRLDPQASIDLTSCG